MSEGVPLGRLTLGFAGPFAVVGKNFDFVLEPLPVDDEEDCFCLANPARRALEDVFLFLLLLAVALYNYGSCCLACCLCSLTDQPSSGRPSQMWYMA